MTTADPISLAQAQRLAANADTILLRATRPADLETPIGAFLRLDDGGPAYLLESVEGGERLGRYSFLGVGPRRLLEVRDGDGPDPDPPGHRADLLGRPPDRDDPRPTTRSTRSARSSRAAASSRPRGCRGSPAARSARSRTTRCPPSSRPCRSRERDPVGVPTAAFIETDLVLVFDHLTHTLSAIASLHTDAPDLEGRYRIAEEAIFEALERTVATERGRDGRRPFAFGRWRGHRDRAGFAPAPRRVSASRPRPASAATSTSTPSRSPRRRSRPGEAIQVVLARRQSFDVADRPGDRRPARRDRALPGAPPGQSEPVPVLHPDTGLRGRRRLAGAPAPGRGRPADDPPDRRHAPARRRRPRGRPARRGAPARPEGTRRARDARRPRPQRPRAGLPAGHGHRQQVHGGRALQPRPPPRVARRGRGSGRGSTRSTPCARSSRRARCRARPRSARCS